MGIVKQAVAKVYHDKVDDYLSSLYDVLNSTDSAQHDLGRLLDALDEAGLSRAQSEIDAVIQELSAMYQQADQLLTKAREIVDGLDNPRPRDWAENV